MDDRTCPPPKVQRRWPLDPLHRYAAATVGRMVHRPEGYCPGCAFVPSTAHANCLSMVALAELLGVNRKTVQQWKAKGLCDEAADHAAVALGVVPGELWDGWYEAALEVAA